MKVFVTRTLPSFIIAKLETAAAVEVYASDQPISLEELRVRVADADALVCMLTEPIDRVTIDSGPSLKVIANVAVGYNNIDVAYARARGVVVTNTPDVLTGAVADFTWALILTITRRVSEGERMLRRGEWTGWAFDQLLGSSLSGKQLGIIGFGRIGQAVAARASGFGMRVAYSSRREQAATSGESGTPYERMSVDRLLNTSDVVSLHVPLSADTRHVIDKRALARMKRSAFLINTARGPIVDEEALAWALEHRLLAGAALDVYEREPEVHPALLTLDNVVLAPHLGSATTETRSAMASLAADNVIAVLGGRQPLTPVA